MIMYHGSPFAGLTELGTLSRTHDEMASSAVYLTPNRSYALFYIRDLEINYVTCGVTEDGYIRYDENFPGQLKTLYEGKSGFLYICESNDKFEKTSTRDVWVSKNPVVVTDIEKIPDAYAEILKCEAAGLVKVIRYEMLSEERKREIYDMILHSIYKNNYPALTSKKAMFYKDNYTQAWNYALAHPDERQKNLEEWDRRHGKK